jgi:hypothetical protein
MEKFTAGLVYALVGVCAKIVPLGLQQIRRKPLAAVAVKIGKGAG